MTIVCNNKVCLCTCKNSFVSICELDFDQPNTTTRPDSGCFRPCRFTRIRLCLKTESFFFSAWPTVYTKSKNTLLSYVELLKTPAYRLGADGRVKTDMMSLLQRFCVEERKIVRIRHVWTQFFSKLEKKSPFSKISECDLNVTVWRKHKCNSLINPLQKLSRRKRKHKDKEKNFLFSCTFACVHAFLSVPPFILT